MKAKLGFIYSVLAYLIGFSAILLWISFSGNLHPAVSIDGAVKSPTWVAILKNLGLITIFGVQHSVMARATFKKWITQFIPEYLERSTYILFSGLFLALLIWQWEPLGGTVWIIEASNPAYYLLYTFFFLGWGLLFFSSFVINHFDLFGLRQAYLNLIGRPYTPLVYKEISLYKYVRHPLYLGMVLGVWCTPNMTITHLLYAILITAYVLTGIYFEEQDLLRSFGDTYADYQRRVPKLLPSLRIKTRRKTPKTKPVKV